MSYIPMIFSHIIKYEDYYVMIFDVFNIQNIMSIVDCIPPQRETL